MDESTPAVEYPRSPSSLPSKPQAYRKDASQAMYVFGASGVGLLMHVVHALGFNTTSGHRFGAILLTALHLLRLVGGVGMLVSRRWGLALVLLASLLYLGLGMLGSRGSAMTSGFLWMLFSLWFIVYCTMRLIGREGPRPI